MQVFWLEQRQQDAPSDNNWLTLAEQLRLSSFRIPKRQADWRLGRWTAKLAVSAYLRLPPEPDVLQLLEIRPAESGAPVAFLKNRPSEAAVSISHRAGVAVCAVAPPETALGCDLELIEPRGDCFIRDYFAPHERLAVDEWPASARHAVVTLIWSAKESALKALHEGLRLDTRSVRVNLPKVSPCRTSNWQQLTADCLTGERLSGWWNWTDDHVRTLLSAPPAEQPVNLMKAMRNAMMPRDALLEIHRSNPAS